ncbi:phosphotransferase family protein [Nocardioides sp.]|uniref:phosphotransferase family protein n=1 Tax=Nocardioides sp. TaxID=35761 RepID=UPI0037852B91
MAESSTARSDEDVLGPEQMGAVLERVGVHREVVSVRPLSGGVSSDVQEVVTTTDRLVVKIALPRLKVAEDWFASVSRAAVERRALTLAGGWTPGAVPDVVAYDDEAAIIVLRHLGDGLTPWKPELLAGRTRPGTGARLARLLAAWQWHGADGVDMLGPDAAANFEELRTAPFYRTVAERMPEVADEVASLVADAAARHDVLVHGDFSPKNILVGAHTVVLDWEVAHLGDPAYDPAFLSCHLLLKSIARPASGVTRILDEFTGTLALLLPDLDWSRVWRHAGALLLARVVGKSPVDYLDDDRARQALALGRRLLAIPPDTALAAAELLGEAPTSTS